MANYKLLIRTKNAWPYMSWAKKADGSKFSGEVSFLVESRYKDRVYVDDLIKQTGIQWDKSYSRPTMIMNANGWTVECLD